MSKFTDTVWRNTPKGFPNLACGWPVAEFGIDWNSYIDDAKDTLDNMYEGEDIPVFQSFKAYEAKWMDENPERDDLGFSHEDCDLCGNLPGDRYAVTALPDSPAENSDYVALRVCGDCLLYIANGDEPEDWE